MGRRGFGRLSLFAFGLIFSGGLAAQTVRVVDIQPTALFPKSEPLRQIALLHIENNGRSTLDTTIVSVLADQSSRSMPLWRPVARKYELLLPDIAAPSPTRGGNRHGRRCSHA